MKLFMLMIFIVGVAHATVIPGDIKTKIILGGEYSEDGEIDAQDRLDTKKVDLAIEFSKEKKISDIILGIKLVGKTEFYTVEEEENGNNKRLVRLEGFLEF